MDEDPWRGRTHPRTTGIMPPSAEGTGGSTGGSSLKSTLTGKLTTGKGLLKDLVKGVRRSMQLSRKPPAPAARTRSGPPRADDDGDEDGAAVQHGIVSCSSSGCGSSGSSPGGDNTHAAAATASGAAPTPQWPKPSSPPIDVPALPPRAAAASLGDGAAAASWGAAPEGSVLASTVTSDSLRSSLTARPSPDPKLQQQLQLQLQQQRHHAIHAVQTRPGAAAAAAAASAQLLGRPSGPSAAVSALPPRLSGHHHPAPSGGAQAAPLLPAAGPGRAPSLGTSQSLPAPDGALLAGSVHSLDAWRASVRTSQSRPSAPLAGAAAAPAAGGASPCAPEIHMVWPLCLTSEQGAPTLAVRVAGAPEALGLLAPSDKRTKVCVLSRRTRDRYRTFGKHHAAT